MTKTGCIPGLRLGYFTAHADIISYVSKYRMPWSVNVNIKTEIVMIILVTSVTFAYYCVM